MEKPKTLAEAVYMICNELSDPDKDYISAYGTVGLHHSLGMYIRNEFGLWDRKSALHKFFNEHYGLGHADDMSAIILSIVESKITGSLYNIEEDVNEYKQHWIKVGIDPLTQTEI